MKYHTEKGIGTRCQSLFNLSIIILIYCLSLLFQNPAFAESDQTCFGCHETKGTNKKDFNTAMLGNSVHSILSCESCHTKFSKTNHLADGGASANPQTASEACTLCHHMNSGIHQKLGTYEQKPRCQDCHGTHDVQSINHDQDTCLGCHERELKISFEDGTSLNATIDQKHYKLSVHKKLRCVDCHFGFSSDAHPKRKYKTRRDLTISMSESCRRCHFDKYTQTLESIHSNLMNSGNQNAPVCVDCHGSHTVQSGRSEKLISATRCKNCHSDIYETYTKSVHGEALLSAHNQDVPICSDCHSAHRIEDPREINFRNEIPQMCSNCHANEDIMNKYGLSTNVLGSYLEDFHGVTLTYYKKEDKPVRHIAVCIDCHGIHDITKTDAPNSNVVKENLLKRCQKCHPEASQNFPDTWISHYEPTFKRAPLVYLVTLFYKLFIPFMIVGLILQVLLHIWRHAVNR